jgi:hypothetical protein
MAARETVAARSGQACEACHNQKARCRPSNVQNLCEKYVSFSHVTFEGICLLMEPAPKKTLCASVGSLSKSGCDWVAECLRFMVLLLMDVL